MEQRITKGPVLIEPAFKTVGERTFKTFSVVRPKSKNVVKLNFGNRAQAEIWAYLAGYDLPGMPYEPICE